MAEFAPLLESARAGDREALDALVRRFLPRIRAYVRLRSGPLLRLRESQSDLVQTVCRQLVEDLDGFRGRDERAFQAWLSQLALHKLTERARYHAAERRDPAREIAAAEADGLLASYATVCSPSRDAAAREQVARIERAFDALSEDHREVITLACLLEQQHRDIAERLGRSEEAVRQLLARARARLAMLLAAPD